MADSRKIKSIAAQVEKLRGDPVGFCRTFLGFDPHDGQVRWLENAWSPENALTTGNRWGKSWIAGAKRIYKCAYTIGWNRATYEAMRRKKRPYHSVNIAYSADQSRLVWNAAQAMLQEPAAAWMIDHITMTPFPRIVFFNGAILEARNTARDGTYLLGHSFDDVNWDEAALEKRFEHVRDNVVRMRLVDRGGQLDYTSTGQGRNEYGRYFLTGLPGEHKDPDLYSQHGTTFENPHLPSVEVERNAKRMSDTMRRQNILGEIIDAAGDYFTLEDILAAHDERLDDIAKVLGRDDDGNETHVVLFPRPEVPWREFYPKHRYLHGWDLADKKDWMVGLSWDLSTTPATLVEYERFHRRGWEENEARMRRRNQLYGGRSGSTKFDSTGVGDVMDSRLTDIGAEGIDFNGGRKDELLTNLASCLGLRKMRWPMIRKLHDEHLFYERDDKGLEKDCVMAAAVSAWWIDRIRPMSFGKISTTLK